jgi:hypothetical protein
MDFFKHFVRFQLRQEFGIVSRVVMKSQIQYIAGFWIIDINFGAAVDY